MRSATPYPFPFGLLRFQKEGPGFPGFAPVFAAPRAPAPSAPWADFEDSSSSSSWLVSWSIDLYEKLGVGGSRDDRDETSFDEEAGDLSL